MQCSSMQGVCDAITAGSVGRQVACCLHPCCGQGAHLHMHAASRQPAQQSVRMFAGVCHQQSNCHLPATAKCQRTSEQCSVMAVHIAGQCMPAFGKQPTPRPACAQGAGHAGGAVCCCQTRTQALLRKVLAALSQPSPSVYAIVLVLHCCPHVCRPPPTAACRSTCLDCRRQAQALEAPMSS